jgi:hypothetical protein
MNQIQRYNEHIDSLKIQRFRNEIINLYRNKKNSQMITEVDYIYEHEQTRFKYFLNQITDEILVYLMYNSFAKYKMERFKIYYEKVIDRNINLNNYQDENNPFHENNDLLLDINYMKYILNNWIQLSKEFNSCKANFTKNTF